MSSTTKTTASTASTTAPDVQSAFEFPGALTDTSLEVLGRMFYVESSVLKEHSEFFRRFLDSADKINTPPPTNLDLRYEYVSVVDEDSFWGLEAKCKVCSRQFHRCHQIPLNRHPHK